MSRISDIGIEATGLPVRCSPRLRGDDRSRPLWSVLIPTRNCGELLRIAVNSVLNEDYSLEQMEIIILDDCSDDPGEAQDLADQSKGRVRVIRHNQNVGKSANYQSGLDTSRGRLIHLLHGDDLVRPGFYASMQKCFDEFPEAGAVYCESDYINEQGEIIGRTGRPLKSSGLLKGFSATLYVEQQIQTPSIVMRRGVYEQIGGFDHRLPAFEDWEMWFRASLAVPFIFNTECRAAYRVSGGNTSSQSVLSGRRVRLLNLALGIMDSYCPAELAQSQSSARRRSCAENLFRYSITALHAGRRWLWVKLTFRSILTAFSLRRTVRHLRNSLSVWCRPGNRVHVTSELISRN